jgi:hypothetical protein
MYLGNPLLPLTLPVDKALVKVEAVLKEKNLTDFEIGTMKLVLIPYFFFNYHYYTQKEENNQLVVDETIDGKLVLNANKLKIEKDLLKLFEQNVKKITNDAPKLEFVELETLVGKIHQNEILQIKTAEEFNIPKNQVAISSVNKYYLPMYETFITINKENYRININALDGNIHGVDKVPEREKGFLEITRETLNELKDPKVWLKYSKEILGETTKKVVSSEVKIEKKNIKETKIDLSIFSSKWMLAFIIILALFIIFIAIFY